MAFAQQQRRPTQRHNNNDDLYSDQTTLNVPTTAATSDSDNDWHIISSALPSSTTSTSSPLLIPTSGSESSFRLASASDTESVATTDKSDHDEPTFLPSHDGTGTFVMEDVDFFSSDQNATSQDESCSSDGNSNSAAEFKSALQNLTRADDSILDILLPNGTPPSFMNNKKAELPNFVPTIAGLNSEEIITNGLLSSSPSSILLLAGKQQQSNAYTTDNEKNLDIIPIHHPGIEGSPSTSAAILSIVWDRLKRLTNHLIENDTNTVETISNLMSEAVLEGCMPFGSHLHMEINPRNYYSLLEG
jgi:hypothetical protein